MIHQGQSVISCDTAIIGAGILGLWAARHALKRGESVIVIEKRTIGAGASGGFLGALMPHMPDAWNPKKQFQYDGLSTIHKAIAELEIDTGIDCGYRRCGRIMPLAHEKVLPQVERRIAGAKAHWENQYTMSVSSQARDWINPEIAPHGLQYDNFSARINPRSCLDALAAYVRPRGQVLEGVAATSPRMTNGEGRIDLSDGNSVVAGKVVVASGWEAYPLLQPFMAEMNSGKPIGRGVKGQAVLVAFKHDDTMPIIYHDGVYVVPHKHDRVAIGSTSLNQWSGEPDRFDPQDMTFYEKATQLVPALKDASIIDRWASVRPRNTFEGRGTSPFFGAVPGHENLIALIGGFKITLGVAHLEKGFA